MNKIFFSALTLITLLSCCNNLCHYLDEKENLCNKVTCKTAKELKLEFGLIPCGSGGRALDEVKMLALAFDYHQPLEIESARKLLIAAVDKFTAEINKNESIRPYLFNFPFKPKNIEIIIYIHDKKGNDYGQDKLCIVNARNGLLEYKIHTPDKYGIINVYQESYDEAVKKLSELSTIQTVCD